MFSLQYGLPASFWTWLDVVDNGKLLVQRCVAFSLVIRWDEPEITPIRRLFRMILGEAGGRLSLLSGTKAFRLSPESDY